LIGHRKGGFSLESAGTATDYKNGESQFKNNIIAVYGKPYIAGDAGALGVLSDADIKTKAETEGNQTLASRDAVMLTDPFNLNTPNFMPKTGSPALSGADFAGIDAFFATTTYRGAFGSTNWLQGWSSFSPKTNSY
jgi:hypothetical protein